MASEINNFVGENYFRYLYVTDSEYSIKLIVDTFSDFLWVERYCGHGEFEITMPINQRVLENCFVGDYVTIRESDVVMIVETISITSDAVNGDTMTISGRSLESILDRRIILDDSIGTINEDGSSNPIGVQTAIQTILNNNVINSADSNRRIQGFSFKVSADTAITNLTMESFEPGDEFVYDKILSICQEKDLGFRVNAVGKGNFQFELYFGVDRTWDQSAVPAVIFSDSYENLANSNYLQTMTDHKNVVYVRWNWTSETETEEGTERDSGVETTETYRDKNYSGLSRRETFTVDNETHDIGPNKNKTAAINQAKDIGKEYLSKYKTTEYFEGETEPYRQFVYGVDYFLGDIVQLANSYGKTGKCRITELMRSRDSSGVTMIPTFKKIEGDD